MKWREKQNETFVNISIVLNE